MEQEIEKMGQRVDKIEAVARDNEKNIAVIQNMISNFDIKLTDIQISQKTVETKIDGIMEKAATKEEVKFIKWGIVIFIFVVVAITGSELGQALLGVVK